MNDKLFVLLRLGVNGGLPPDGFSITAEQWPQLLEQARRQAVLGIALQGAGRLPQDSWPPRPLLLQWVAATESIKRRNKALDEMCRRITTLLEGVGIESCVLKGQGVARRYPAPELRQSGDIDIWVRIADWNGSIDGCVREIRRRIDSIGMGVTSDVVYHHLQWIVDDVEVEVHYRPMAFNNPVANRRFMRWAKGQWEQRVWCDGYYVPSDDFNAVYLLAHLYHHLLFEGVGLRQLCDYYIIMRGYAGHRPQQLFGMRAFAAGIDWVMGYVFGYNGSCADICDSREGRFILGEMIAAGNFGAFDRRHNRRQPTFLRRTLHRWRFVRRYPVEVLCDIPFRLYHWCWRKVYAR